MSWYEFGQLMIQWTQKMETWLEEFQNFLADNELTTDSYDQHLENPQQFP